jgi:hypothetical protein
MWLVGYIGKAISEFTQPEKDGSLFSQYCSKVPGFAWPAHWQMRTGKSHSRNPLNRMAGC